MSFIPIQIRKRLFSASQGAMVDFLGCNTPRKRSSICCLSERTVGFQGVTRAESMVAPPVIVRVPGFEVGGGEEWNTVGEIKGQDFALVVIHCEIIDPIWPTTNFHHQP